MYAPGKIGGSSPRRRPAAAVAAAAAAAAAIFGALAAAAPLDAACRRIFASAELLGGPDVLAARPAGGGGGCPPTFIGLSTGGILRAAAAAEALYSEEDLRVFGQLLPQACYAGVEAALCGGPLLQRAPARPGCYALAETLTARLMQCMQNGRDARCPALAFDSGIVSNPAQFCAGTFGVNFGPEDAATGLPAFEEKVTLLPAERPECEDVAENYNVCIRAIAALRASDSVAARVNYCATLNGRFAGYCDAAAVAVEEASFRSMCEGTVVPALAETLAGQRGVSQRRFLFDEADACELLPQRWMGVLARQKGLQLRLAADALAVVRTANEAVTAFNRQKTNELGANKAAAEALVAEVYRLQTAIAAFDGETTAGVFVAQSIVSRFRSFATSLNQTERAAAAATARWAQLEPLAGRVAGLTAASQGIRAALGDRATAIEIRTTTTTRPTTTTTTTASPWSIFAPSTSSTPPPTTTTTTTTAPPPSIRPAERAAAVDAALRTAEYLRAARAAEEVRRDATMRETLQRRQDAADAGRRAQRLWTLHNAQQQLLVTHAENG